MKFLVDTQLPPKLADYLSARGFAAIHTTFFADGHLLGDGEIVGIAKDQSRTIVSKDSDFWDNYLLKGAPPKVLILEFGNIANRELLALFDKYFDMVLNAFEGGSQLVVFRRDQIIEY